VDSPLPAAGARSPGRAALALGSGCARREVATIPSEFGQARKSTRRARAWNFASVSGLKFNTHPNGGIRGPEFQFPNFKPNSMHPNTV
jgi:hypothetical protein